jgi:Concanavalin A-like lectin/glucanases superfamily
MSTSLIVLVPVVLLGIVGLLCFAGCGLDTHGTADPFSSYSGTTVLLNSAVIAYWPLREAADTEPAAELISGNTGNYIDQNSSPQLYPWPAFAIQNPPNPDVLSAAAPGDIAFQQPGLLKGDAVSPDKPDVLFPCVVVNGCYIEVPWNAKFVPQGSFTVEAWVRVDWSDTDPSAWRFVLDMRDFNPGKGFAIFAKADDDQPGKYRWAGMVGNGSSGAAGLTTITSDELPITLSSSGAPAEPVYLALTYNATTQTLTLFVNGVQQGLGTSVPYVPNTAQPLWIGAGAPYVVRRPAQPAGEPGSPLFPFHGAIQDVAIYSDALAADVILLHYQNGTGISPKKPDP